MEKIEAVEDMAKRIAWAANPSTDSDVETYTGVATDSIRARDEQIAAWCEAKAGEAEREERVHQQMIGQLSSSGWTHQKAAQVQSHELRESRCEGQASVFRALAAILKGAHA